MYEPLEFMQFSCPDCLVGGEWGNGHCVCEIVEELDWEEEEEEPESEGGTSGSECGDGWETDTEEGEGQQNEGMASPAEVGGKSQKTISPENAATKAKQMRGKALFQK